MAQSSKSESDSHGIDYSRTRSQGDLEPDECGQQADAIDDNREPLDPKRMPRGMSSRTLLIWIGMFAIRSMGFGRQWITTSPLRTTSRPLCRNAENIDDLLDEITTNNPAIGVSSAVDVSQDPSSWETITWPSKDDVGVDPSPLTTVLTEDRLVSVKRDDLLRLPGSQLSGNKARKVSCCLGVLAPSTLNERTQFYFVDAIPPKPRLLRIPSRLCSQLWRASKQCHACHCCHHSIS